MTSPLRDARTAGKCECGHFARPDEITPCRFCDCPRHVSSPGPRGGHDPMTPPGAEAALDDLKDALEEATAELVRARNAELDAEEARDEAKRAALLSPECPVPSRGGWTVAQQGAWVAEQFKAEESAYKAARTARQAASDHVSKVSKQASVQQSIAGSVKESYRGQRGEGF